METKKGDIFKSISDGADYTVKKVIKSMALLESQDGKTQIITGVGTLNIKSFYQKKKGTEG